MDTDFIRSTTINSRAKEDLFLVDQTDDQSYINVAEEETLHNRQERQATESSSDTSQSSSLVDIPQPIFFPQVVGNFQLALKSNHSIVVVIGNDENIYLSSQSSTGTPPSTFSLLDLGLSNRSYVALIQDAQNHRYLHSYNDIQDQSYSRIRTHLDTYMPCNANIMFWTFVRGYMQFYRGGLWFYDTAACLDTLTGLVRIWLINGQQGLTALQAKYGTCGLAPLVAINY